MNANLWLIGASDTECKKNNINNFNRNNTQRQKWRIAFIDERGI